MDEIPAGSVTLKVERNADGITAVHIELGPGDPQILSLLTGLAHAMVATLNPSR